MAAPRKLDYRPPTEDKPQRAADSPAAILSLAFAPFALVVDLVLYAVADSSGRQAFLGAAAIAVIGLGVIGAALGTIGFLHRGRRKVAAVFAVPLHVGIATWFGFMVGNLA